MSAAYPVGELVPWSARPSIPDPADRATNEDRCDRCWRENHEACPDFKALGFCCCEVDR